MVLSDKQVEEFQKIYKDYFGKEISKEDAYEKGTKLVRLMLLIYKPMTKAEYNYTQEKRKKLLADFDR